jgi:hypothetical protein
VNTFRLARRRLLPDAPNPEISLDKGERSAMWLLWIFGVIIWVAIAFWPARVAARKGHSFIGYFLLSLLFFPLSLIMAYVVDDRGVGAYA